MKGAPAAPDLREHGGPRQGAFTVQTGRPGNSLDREHR
jgi:hypothetical protein